MFCSFVKIFSYLSFKMEADAAADTKEESDEDEEDDEESERLRFKTERKDSTVVRLSDASKRRNIPETLGTSPNRPTHQTLSSGI